MAGGHSVEARRARRLWEATQTDVALLTDLRTAYRGRLDLQDALWWRAHPLTPTASGTPDPAAALRPLQEAVFSKEAESGQVAQKAEELRAIAAQLARDGADLDAVLERFGDWEANSSARSSDTRSGTSGPTDAQDDRPDDRQPAVPDPTPLVHRAHPLLLIAVGAVLGVLATIAVQAIQGEPVATDASSSQTGSQTGSQRLSEFYETDSSAGGDDGVRDGAVSREGNVLQIFFRPSLFPDGVVPSLGEDIEPETIRPVVFGTDDPDYQVYAARNVAGEYCLFLRSGSDTTLSSCTELSHLEQHGTWLETTLHGVTNNAAELRPAVTVRVNWAPDGSFNVDTSPAR